MDRDTIIEKIRANKDRLSEFDVESLPLFGSFARAENNEASGLDILVQFKGKTTFDGYFDLLFFLEELLGLHVDLVTEAALRPSIRTSVLDEAIRVA
jgi:predicted nucleotidyltransferase